MDYMISIQIFICSLYSYTLYFFFIVYSNDFHIAEYTILNGLYDIHSNVIVISSVFFY
ncbi:hypothetical protein GLOIN_2v1644444, partial [Rhizophagus irregularis DAOM 181602=DAOM 197198]